MGDMGSLIEPLSHLTESPCAPFCTREPVPRPTKGAPMTSVALRLPAATRRTLSEPLAYALSAAIIGFALFASATPSPLYATYSRLWGFSPVVLTLVYATYALGVLAALLLAGRVSDVAGRRPVLLIALAALIFSSVIYMLAESVAWLFAARAVQ